MSECVGSRDVSWNEKDFESGQICFETRNAKERSNVDAGNYRRPSSVKVIEIWALHKSNGAKHEFEQSATRVEGQGVFE